MFWIILETLGHPIFVLYTLKNLKVTDPSFWAFEMTFYVLYPVW